MTVIPLRDRKKQSTRRAIADAALRLAVERGPAAVTVEDIAAAAEVSPRTVFNYFATKDEAILGVDPDRRAELCELIVERPANESPLEALCAVFVDAVSRDVRVATSFRTKARLVRAHPHLQAAYVASQQALQDDVTAALAQRTGLDAERDLYPELVASVALATFRSVLNRTTNRTPAAIGAALENAFRVLADGLTPPSTSR